MPEDAMRPARRHRAADAALRIGGAGALGVLQLEFRIGAFNCLSGPSGAGKTRVMHEVVVPILKGRKNTYETSDLPLPHLDHPKGQGTSDIGLGIGIDPAAVALAVKAGAVNISILNF